MPQPQIRDHSMEPSKEHIQSDMRTNNNTTSRETSPPPPPRSEMIVIPKRTKRNKPQNPGQLSA